MSEKPGEELKREMQRSISKSRSRTYRKKKFIKFSLVDIRACTRQLEA